MHYIICDVYVCTSCTCGLCVCIVKHDNPGTFLSVITKI